MADVVEINTAVVDLSARLRSLAPDLCVVCEETCGPPDATSAGPEGLGRVVHTWCDDDELREALERVWQLETFARSSQLDLFVGPDLEALDPFGLGVGGLDEASAAAALGAWHEFLEAERADRFTARLDVFGRVEVLDVAGEVVTRSSWSTVRPDFDELMRAVHWRGLGPELRRRVLNVVAELRGTS